MGGISMAKGKGLTEPKLDAQGKKDWVGFYAQLSDAQTLVHVTKTLQKMPMTYLKLLGDRLALVKQA